MAKEDKETGVSPDVLAILEEMRRDRADAPARQAKAFEKVTNPSNKVAPHISHFNPRGEKDYPMPRLKCEMHAPWKMHPEYHGLDREEVELFNLLEPGEYTATGTDDATIKIRIVGRVNDATGALERLDMKCEQFTAEHKGQRLPAMRTMLREILGEKAKTVMPITQERKLVLSGQLEVSQA